MQSEHREQDEYQEYIKVVQGDQVQCQNWIKDIIGGKYNMPRKENLGSLIETLKAINRTLESITQKLPSKT